MASRQDELLQAVEGLQRLTALVERRRQQLARGVGLSLQQWSVLDDIARDDFLPSLFARARRAHPAAVSRTLRQLLERGLVAVEIGEGDGRRRQYALTAPGRRLLAELHEAREHALDAVWSGFSSGDLAAFAGFADRLASRLEAYAAEADAD